MQIAGGWTQNGHEVSNVAYLWYGSTVCRWCWSHADSFSVGMCERSMDVHEILLTRTSDPDTAFVPGVLLGEELHQKALIEKAHHWKNPGL